MDSSHSSYNRGINGPQENEAVKAASSKKEI
jgi:hypothetical protein